MAFPVALRLPKNKGLLCSPAALERSNSIVSEPKFLQDFLLPLVPLYVRSPGLAHRIIRMDALWLERPEVAATESTTISNA